MKNQKYITKDMTIGDVIKKYPQAVSVFMDYGLHCVNCMMAGPETIEEAVNVHSVDLNKFLDALNKAVEKK